MRAKEVAAGWWRSWRVVGGVALAFATEVSAQAGAILLPVERYELTRSWRFDGRTSALFGSSVAISSSWAAIGGSGDAVLPIRHWPILDAWSSVAEISGRGGRVAVAAGQLAIGNSSFDTGRGRVSFYAGALTTMSFLDDQENPGATAYHSSFGFSVAMAGGITAVGVPYGGKVYICQPVVGITDYVSSPTMTAEEFGIDVALWASSSGRLFRLAVGARSNSQNATGAGAVYLFQRDLDVSGDWVPDGQVYGSTTNGNLGCSVAIDSNTLISGSGAGQAFIHYRTGSATWTSRGALSDPAGDGLAHGFGSSVAFTGGWLAVGAPTDGCGKVVLYDNTSILMWPRMAKQTLTSPDATATGNDNFGADLAIDGTTLIVGAPGYDGSTAGSNCGAAHLFVRTSS